MRARLRSLVTAWLRRSRVERDLVEELNFHLQARRDHWIAIVFAAARAVDDMLYGLTSTDAATMGAAAAALLVSALLAASIPALRAARLDPMTALRAE